MAKIPCQSCNRNIQTTRTRFSKSPKRSETLSRRLRSTSETLTLSPLFDRWKFLFFCFSFPFLVSSRQDLDVLLRILLPFTALRFSTKLTAFPAHRLVIETLEPLPQDRKCFRMINGVLVERTVKDVIPSLKTNSSGLKQVLDELLKQYKSKQDEMEVWKVCSEIGIALSQSSSSIRPVSWC